MLSIRSGYDIKYLTDEVGKGREGYYTGAVAAGEPPGRWHGAGAEALGLVGEVDAEQMEALFRHLLDPRDPASADRSSWGEAERLGKPHKRFRTAQEIFDAAIERELAAGAERRAELWVGAQRAERQAVSFFDVTFSAPKSVSVLGVAFERAAVEARAAGDEQAARAWDAHARAVEDAVMAGARASLDYLQTHAGFARVGHHGGGAGRWTDAHEFVVAQFLQHDSRDRDPQLHVHQTILNRVRCADGAWRALDSKALHTWRAGAAAVAERVMEEYLRSTLGVRFETRPDGKAREVVGVDADMRELFSSRSRAIGPKAAQMRAGFRAVNGRDPSPLEWFHIRQEATLKTRRGKSHHGETNIARMTRWASEAATRCRGGLTGLAHRIVALAQEPAPPARWSEDDVIEQALAQVGAQRAWWSRADLTFALSQALPAGLGLDPSEVGGFLDRLTGRALDRAVTIRGDADATDLPTAGLLGDGRSIYASPSGQRFATPDQITADHQLRAAAVRRGAPAATPEQVSDVLARYAAQGGVELGADQAAALRGVLTSGAWVEGIAAAAGTGKSVTVGAIRDAWTSAGHGRVFGLAPSQVAAEILTDEGLDAANTARWLATQTRLDRPGAAMSGDHRWRLGAGDLVVVDEAGMTTTTDLADIHARCTAAGAKLVLVGDARQLAPVGPGGALADLTAHGITYPLAEVRRFTAEWEGPASLRLRDGDEAALEDYQRHGRLVDGGTPEQAETAAGRAWLADTLTGHQSVLLVGTAEAAARLNASLRARLVELGHVIEDGVHLDRDGTTAGVGDLIQARRNGWDLPAGADGRVPINRRTYRVLAVHDDGGLTVTPADRAAVGVTGLVDDTDTEAEQDRAELRLPASYVAADVTLAYASTVHAAQGRTVDTAHAVIGPGSWLSSVYVALTRGRLRNTAHVITRTTTEDAAPGAVHDTPQRIPHAVLADVLAADREQRSALTEQAAADLEARSTMSHVDRLVDVVTERAIAGRTGRVLDQLTAEGVLDGIDRRRIAADEAYGSVERLLRRAELAGADPEVLLSRAVAGRGFDDARRPAQALYARLLDATGRLTPTIGTYADLIPAHAPTEWAVFLTNRAADADARRVELGAAAAEAPQPWALDALGPVPEAGTEQRVRWERAAGWAASWRELADHTDPDTALGPAPAVAFPEKHAVWLTAHTALDLPDRGADEATLTAGALRARVRAWDREQAWAPDWVGDHLDTIEQAAQRRRDDAAVFTAHATAPDTTPEQAARYATDAAAAAAEADRLDHQAAQLHETDLARARWYTHTAATRDNAERARTELAARGITLDDPDEQTTAADWLDAHHADQAEHDARRHLTEHDLHEADERQAHDGRDVETVEHEPVDVRDTSTPPAEPVLDQAGDRPVPTMADTAAMVARAQVTLAELRNRHQVETAHHADEDERRSWLIGHNGIDDADGDTDQHGREDGTGRDYSATPGDRDRDDHQAAGIS